MSWLEKILGFEKEKEKTPEENLQQLFETEKKLKERTYNGEKTTWENPPKKIFSKKQKTEKPLFVEEKHSSPTEGKYNHLFVGFIIGIIFVLLLGWFFKERPSISDCLQVCEEEGWNRTEVWIRRCGDACFREYGSK